MATTKGRVTSLAIVYSPVRQGQFDVPVRSLVIQPTEVVVVAEVTGAIASTEDNDTASLTGGPIVSGNTSPVGIEASDTASASGSSTLTGSITRTEANDTAALSGSAAVSGTLARTESNDTAALAGSATVAGTIARTEANDNAAATASVSLTGTISCVEASDQAAATGTVAQGVPTASGTVSMSEAADAAVLTGASAIAGTLSLIEANDNGAGTGDVLEPVTGQIAANDNADTAQILGRVRYSLAVTTVVSRVEIVWPALPPEPVAVTLSAPRETNVLGPPRPSNVAVTTASFVRGGFTPTPRPTRVQWRT